MLLNPSQALPGMPQRMFASRLMAPSPSPRARPCAARDVSADRKAARLAEVLGSGGNNPAVPEESNGRADGHSSFGFGTLSPAGAPLFNQAVRKGPSSFGGSTAAERQPMQELNSWQLLQGSGGQPRLSARSQKVRRSTPQTSDHASRTVS